MTSIYELIKIETEKLNKKGHILSDWKTYGSSNNAYGFYGYGNSPDNKAFCNCLLCKHIFTIDDSKFETEYNYHESDENCVYNQNLKLRIPDDTDGVSITTWNFCYLCGKKLGSDKAKARGTCSSRGCVNSFPLIGKIDKNNKFKNLTKLPKNNSTLPILNCVLVNISNNVMQCFMMISTDEGFRWTEEISVSGVSGNCTIAVPRNTFVDMMVMLGEEDSQIEITDNKEKALMFVKCGKMKNTIKGLPAEEFPDTKE